MLLLASVYLIVATLVGMLAFAWDKFCARNDMWRVAESTLLLIATLGGAIGMVVAGYLLRHKTRKEPFRSQLLAIIVVQLVGTVALAIPDVRDAAAAFLASFDRAPR